MKKDENFADYAVLPGIPASSATGSMEGYDVKTLPSKRPVRAVQLFYCKRIKPDEASVVLCRIYASCMLWY